jgi:hypothetical protein
MEGARLYLETEIDKDNSNMREVKIHFCEFIRIMIKNFSCKLNNINVDAIHQIMKSDFSYSHACSGDV